MSNANNIFEGKVFKVVQVLDGDTIKVRGDNAYFTVRALGIDTPESVHPDKPVECYGLEASDKAKEILADQKPGKVDLLNMALLQKQEQDEQGQELSVANLNKKSKLPIILIVEDHYDMRKFLADELCAEYQIIEASDGAKGIKLALEFFSNPI